MEEDHASLKRRVAELQKKHDDQQAKILSIVEKQLRVTPFPQLSFPPVFSWNPVSFSSVPSFVCPGLSNALDSR